MSTCTFIASAQPLPAWQHGEARLLPFQIVPCYTGKPYAAYLEWDAEPEAAAAFAAYARDASRAAGEVELWHVWLDGAYELEGVCEFEERPAFRRSALRADALGAQDILQLADAPIWRRPIPAGPARPTFHCITVTTD